MEKDKSSKIPSFLIDNDNQLDYASIFKLNLYLNAFDGYKKPYKIDYNTLLMSYHLWEGSDLDEFCQKQTISHFLFNPTNDSAEAREALYLEIREFLSGK